MGSMWCPKVAVQDPDVSVTGPHVTDGCRPSLFTSSPNHVWSRKRGKGATGRASFAFFLSETKHVPRSFQESMSLARNGSQDHPWTNPRPRKMDLTCYSGLKSITLSSLGLGPWPAGGQHQSAGGKEGQAAHRPVPSASTPALPNV